MSPDGSAKPLPEEKLLRLIRSKSARAAAPAAAPAATAAVLGQDMARAARSHRWPHLAAMGLGALLLFELLLFVVEALRPAPTIDMPVVNLLPEVLPQVVVPTVPSLAQGATRPLFGTPLDANPGQPVGLQPPSAAVNQLAARLSLLGIVAGNPAQAIIEDSQTQKTYFVSPGQPLAEGAVVEQVLENRVILDLQGEKIELSL